MKRLPYVLLLSLGFALLFSCQKEPELTLISSPTVELSADGSSGTITFTANRDWTISSSESWIHVSPSSGSATDGQITVTVRCDANTTYDARSATVTITAKGLTQTFTVNQPANLGVIVATKEYNLTSEAKTIEVEVQANVQYSVLVSGDWIKQTGTKGLTNNILVFSVDENTTYDNRNATISIKPMDSIVAEQTISVKQAQKDALIVKDSSFNMPYGGGEVEVKVEANVSFDVNTDADWIHYIQTKALSSSTISLVIDENKTYGSRTGNVKIVQKNGTLSHTITVTQQQNPGLFLTKKEFDLTNAAQTIDVEVQKNVNYSVIIDDACKSWITKANTKALSSEVITFNIAANMEYDDREGMIIFKQNDGPLSETVIVHQGQAYGLFITKPEYEISSESQTLSVEVKANVEFEVISQAEWIKFVETKALAQSTIVLAIEVNESDNGRTGTVLVKQTNGDLTGVITVMQEGAALVAERAALVDFYNSTNGDKWVRNDNWCSEKPVHEWYGVYWDGVGHVTDLVLSYNNLSGQIPESIGNLTKLTQLALNNNSLSGPVPSSIGHLKSLFNLVLSSNHLSGELPDSLSELTELKQLFLNDNWFSGDLPDITKMLQLKYFDVSNSSIGAGGGEVALDSTKVHYNQFTGHIPDAIGNLTQLEWYTIGVNRVSGTIPESIWSLPNLTSLQLDNNPITGSISPAVANAKKLEQLYLNNCELSGDIPEEIGELTNLEQLLFGNADAVAGIDHTYASNSLSGTLPQSIGNLTQLKSLDVYNNDLTGTLPESMATMESLTDFLAIGNRFNGEIPKKVMMNPNFPNWRLDPQQQGYGFSYELDSSEDYSKDGAVSVLQKANTGNGINIVLMGDAFIDDDIASGYYDKTMQKAYTALFNVEPFHSFQDYFNVYQVTVVSPNNSYLNGATRALKTEFGAGTVVYGDNEACTGYASKAVGEENMDETLVVVILNSDRYAGTCYMYSPSSGDFGNGYSIAYVPMGTDEEMFNALIHHEANGHGFAKLEDEYAYEYNNTIPDDIKESKRSTEVYGWWPNIDFISDPTAVKWAKFIADSRYVNEGIGVFEGGASYWSGVWRPTEESIMNHNYGTFNAPSREAIYKRIHKLAFGDSWSFDYEEFVKYDKINLTASTKAQGRGVERYYKPLASPVVCKGPIPLKKQKQAHGKEPKEVVFKIVNGRRVIQR